MPGKIKMKKITAKTYDERSPEHSIKAKNLPSGHIDFDDNDDLKKCIIGSEVIIKQKVKITRISETGMGYDIEEMGAVKVEPKRVQRNTKKKNKDENY